MNALQGMDRYWKVYNAQSERFNCNIATQRYEQELNKYISNIQQLLKVI